MNNQELGSNREKRLNSWAWIISVIVFILVLMMRRYKVSTGFDFGFLPAVYSILNTVTFCLLLLAYYSIRVKKNMLLHKNLMQIAILSSGLFLLLYVIYHFTSEETLYCGEGNIRIFYFILLITHVILAALILPFILLTYIRALTGQYKRHRQMARWVWPFWVYVSISGPIIYLMLYNCR